jgi:hypothetical protein
MRYKHKARLVNISHSLSLSVSLLNIMQETWRKRDRHKRHTALHECWMFRLQVDFSKTNHQNKNKNKNKNKKRKTNAKSAPLHTVTSPTCRAFGAIGPRTRPRTTIDHDGPAHSTHMIAVQRTCVLSVPTYSDGSMIALRRRGYPNVSALFDVHPFIRSAVYERRAAVGSMVGDT